VRRIRFLVWKELIELGRDPRLFAIVVLAPVLQLFMLAYAATTDVRNVPLVVADADRSTESRELIRRFEASPSFSLVAVLSAAGDAGRYLEDGRAWMVLAIPQGYGESVVVGRSETLQLVADGSDSNSAGVSLGYANNLLMEYGREIAATRASPAGMADAPAEGFPTPGQDEGGGAIEPRIRVWFNSRLESRDFMIPGIVALLLLAVTTNLSSMAIVRERELGTLEQLNVTPLGRLELIVGKLVPYALVGLVDVVLVVTLAVFWFEVPLRGSVWLLFAMTSVYLLSTLGLGLFVSTISSTQQQAMMTTMFLFFMPMVYLSGFVFPIENMPAVIQPITYLIPLRYFLVILRSIFLKGVGLETFWPEALALTAWGVGILSLALARSSKRAA
jgi:ABC-2 type transport system permease protein